VKRAAIMEHPASRGPRALEQLLRDYRDLARRYQALVERSRGERDLARARELLAEEERMRALGELASGVAHDLNSVLHAMALRIASLRRARDDEASGAALAALSRLVGEGAARVARLQDLARRRRDAPRSDADLGVVSGAAVEAVRPELERRRRAGCGPVSIELGVPPQTRVVGSEDELRHVLSGLLLNAFDAMPRGGVVRVSAEARGDRVLATVEDEGTGIAESALGRLFDPLFTTKGEKGTGLGLAIARSVMRRLGGEIRARNGRRGARFELDFPAARPRAAERRAGPPRPGGRVLVVDDDADVLEAARLVLDDMGQRAAIATSGRAAIALCRRERFDVVLCDVGMPDLDGWATARELRGLLPNARIYLVTGWANEIAPDDPRCGEIAGVLPKPLPMEVLEAVLAGAPSRPSGRAPGAEASDASAAS
jgi:signal transduction histidine kinase/CheY-like chemotaxis protein